MSTLNRRRFLHVASASSAAVALGACAIDEPRDEELPVDAAVFPQGVASGDPKATSVVLWTRVTSSDGAPVTVHCDVARDEALSDLVLSTPLEASADDDHTLRVKVDSLEAYTHYYYRFRTETAASVTGRTKTAPALDQDEKVRFAFASCQDYNGRYYHSWRALAEEDEVDFVLFLGDYIYETTGNPSFQAPTEARNVSVPDGMALGDGEDSYYAALTVADYRALYRQFRSDPDLQEAHRLYPFVTIWDDHEFSDDSWQDHANYFDGTEGDEQNTARREASSRAWFEYTPADLSFDADAGFPSDLSIYRQLRFGKHVELFLTDQRSYRDDHLITEGPTNAEVGKIFPESSLGSRYFVLKSGFDTLEAATSPSPTMLGDNQKQWLLDSMGASNATWKIWGSETQLGQMTIDLSDLETLPEQYKNHFYFNCDQWDGYRTERAEILTAVGGAGENVVVLTGDIHAFYATELHADFDNPSDPPLAVEFVCAGISSAPVQELTQNTVDGNATLSDLGLGDIVPMFDQRLTAAGPHYKFARSNVNGIGIVDVEGDQRVRVTMLTTGDVKNENFDPNDVKRDTFLCEAGSNRIDTA